MGIIFFVLAKCNPLPVCARPGRSRSTIFLLTAASIRCTYRGGVVEGCLPTLKKESPDGSCGGRIFPTLKKEMSNESNKKAPRVGLFYCEGIE
jgi:hypothetical protein